MINLHYVLYENAVLNSGCTMNNMPVKGINELEGRHIPLIPAFGMQGQAGLCEFKASLVFLGSFRTTRATK